VFTLLLLYLPVYLFVQAQQQWRGVIVYQIQFKIPAAFVQGLSKFLSCPLALFKVEQPGKKRGILVMG